MNKWETFRRTLSRCSRMLYQPGKDFQMSETGFLPSRDDWDYSDFTPAFVGNLGVMGLQVFGDLGAGRGQQ